VPDDDLTRDLYLALGRLVRSLRREHGDQQLGVGMVSALSQLATVGPMRASALADAERISAASMTRVLNVLESRGLVRRTADATDGRAQIVALTEAGEQVLAEGTEAKLAALGRRVETLAVGQREALAAAVPVLAMLAEPVASAGPTG